MMADIVERLLERDVFGKIQALRAEVAALREGLTALLPNKLCGESWDLPDEETVEITITFGELKRARAVLERSDNAS
jgi:hypothetical protein